VPVGAGFAAGAGADFDADLAGDMARMWAVGAGASTESSAA